MSGRNTQAAVAVMPRPGSIVDLIATSLFHGLIDEKWVCNGCIHGSEGETIADS
jgi:hypothetical protein